jgi:hypothetical protein
MLLDPALLEIHSRMLWKLSICKVSLEVAENALELTKVYEKLLETCLVSAKHTFVSKLLSGQLAHSLFGPQPGARSLTSASHAIFLAGSTAIFGHKDGSGTGHRSM